MMMMMVIIIILRGVVRTYSSSSTYCALRFALFLQLSDFDDKRLHALGF